MCTDENNKIYFEHIALYIKKVDKNRFIKAMFNEVTKAAYANPHNTYYIQLRRYDE